MKIEIYGRDDCRFCAAARVFCEKNKLPYVYIDTTHDHVLAEEMQSRAPDATTVPQIFIGAHRIGGYDDLRRSLPVIQQIIGGH